MISTGEWVHGTDSASSSRRCAAWSLSSAAGCSFASGMRVGYSMRLFDGVQQDQLGVEELSSARPELTFDGDLIYTPVVHPDIHNDYYDL